MPKLGRSTTPKVAIALLAGFVMFLLLVQTSGAEPPLCYGFLAYRVPCEGGTAIAAGAATAGVIALALWLSDRRRRRDRGQTNR
jgi:hypothetical protein